MYFIFFQKCNLFTTLIQALCRSKSPSYQWLPGNSWTKNTQKKSRKKEGDREKYRIMTRRAKRSHIVHSVLRSRWATKEKKRCSLHRPAVRLHKVRPSTQWPRPDLLLLTRKNRRSMRCAAQWERDREKGVKWRGRGRENVRGTPSPQVVVSFTLTSEKKREKGWRSKGYLLIFEDLQTITIERKLSTI